ncbi:hypothetical protein KIL84_010223 [Mauremys mutica]|uniref:Uncharacterized protein n=1 Tax=Mauremys mutica TaxID=74926 RepID=A0A9D3XJ74_9SAUR|nr:hypothetical protein KIL84_010223 [Mauremys mutica]
MSGPVSLLFPLYSPGDLSQDWRDPSLGAPSLFSHVLSRQTVLSASLVQWPAPPRNLSRQGLCQSSEHLSFSAANLAHCVRGRTSQAASDQPPEGEEAVLGDNLVAESCLAAGAGLLFSRQHKPASLPVGIPL